MTIFERYVSFDAYELLEITFLRPEIREKADEIRRRSLSIMMNPPATDIASAYPLLCVSEADGLWLNSRKLHP